MTRRLNLFIAVYLAVQLLLPLRGFLQDYVQTRGDFSWKMYSVLYECRELYTRVLPNGARLPLEADPSFRYPPRVEELYHRDRLRAFHAWLCGSADRIEGTLLCSLDKGGEVPLVQPGVNLCSSAP